MRKVKVLIVTTSLLLGSFFYAGAQECYEDLDEVGITCNSHTWDLEISGGFLSLTWHFSTITCDNGFEQTIMI